MAQTYLAELVTGAKIHGVESRGEVYLMTDAEDPTLFDVPADAYTVPPPPEILTRSERRRRLVATRIANGVHPLGRPVLLHPDADRTITEAGHPTTTPTCGTCRFRVLLAHRAKTYPKCWFPDEHSGVPHPRDTGCESSDIRAWWPGCREYSEVSEVSG